MPGNKYLIVVGGPTASGKTRLAIELARHFDTEIVSADSRQFFRELNIGTAKPTPEERALAPHHFIDHLSIRQAYSVGAFERDALALLNDLFTEQDVVILTGGSGLYLKAVCEGLDEFPEVPATFRQQVEALYSTRGLEGLREKLQMVDPDYYAEVDLHNPHRLIRALAVQAASGRPFSSFRTAANKERSFTPVYLSTWWPREVLYERINRRVDEMLAAGLLGEVAGLAAFREHTALQTVGYQELFDHLDGRIDLPEAIRLIKRNTRRYAKRQLTWMRRDGFWKHFPPEAVYEITDYLDRILWSGWTFDTQLLEGGAVRELSFRRQDALLAVLRLRVFHKGYLLDELRVADQAAGSWLLSEAVMRIGEQVIWALSPPGSELLFSRAGFVPVEEASPPSAIREYIAFAEGRLWMYDPATAGQG